MCPHTDPGTPGETPGSVDIPWEITEMKKHGFWFAILMAMALVIPAGSAIAQEDSGTDEGKPAKVKKAKGEKKPKADKPKAEKPKREKKQKEPRPKKGEWETVWMVVIKEVGLTEAQQATLKQKVEAKNAALAEWKAANGEKLAELKKSYAEARKAEDKDKVKAIRDEMNKLSAEEKSIAVEKQAACMAVLDAEQKAKWDGVLLYEKVSRKYGKVDLDETQKGKMKGICLEGAKQLAGAEDKAKKEITRKIESDCAAVLTDEQKAKIARPKSDKPKREKADKPAKVKKDKPAKDNDGDEDDMEDDADGGDEEDM